ncbi:hypothetical protein OH77DRAFT_709706 [Trametes cingulata]|nr:hypothetical protein OH77DRAFT_709706 [Trametes cingulata]
MTRPPPRFRSRSRAAGQATLQGRPWPPKERPDIPVVRHLDVQRSPSACGDFRQYTPKPRPDVRHVDAHTPHGDLGHRAHLIHGSSVAFMSGSNAHTTRCRFPGSCHLSESRSDTESRFYRPPQRHFGPSRTCGEMGGRTDGRISSERGFLRFSGGRLQTSKSDGTAEIAENSACAVDMYICAAGRAAESPAAHTYIRSTAETF